MSRRTGPTERPPDCTINPYCDLAQGLVFAGLGGFAGGGKYHDSSLFGNHGTLTGYSTDPANANHPSRMWQYDNYLRRMVLGFNGTSDYVSLGTSKTIKPTGFASWSWWVNMSTSGGYMLGDLGGSGNRGFQVESVVNDIAIGIYVAPTATTLFGTSSTPATYLGAWHHFLAIFKPSIGLYLYSDDSLIYSNTSSPPDSLYQNSLSFNIGNRGVLGEYIVGAIGDFTIANADWSPYVAALADPSNVMLSDLVACPRRKSYATLQGTTIRWPWEQRRRHRMYVGDR